MSKYAEEMNGDYEVDTLEFEVMNAKTDEYRKECLDALLQSHYNKILQELKERLERISLIHEPEVSEGIEIAIRLIEEIKTDE